MTGRNWDAFVPGIALIALDQWQKDYVYHHFLPNETLPLIEPYWLSLTRVPNSGLIFKMREMVFEPRNALYVPYLPALVIVLLAIFYLWAKRHLQTDGRADSRGDFLFDFFFALLWCGGFSNLLSSWQSVFVDDTFLLRPWLGARYYPFNLADLGLLFGILGVGAFLLAKSFATTPTRSPLATRPKP